MNIVILIGRLVADPDVRATEKTTVARFRLAVDRRSKKGEANFINCVAFGKTAEFVDKYVMKGTKVALHGSITSGSYTDREGRTVYTTDIVAEELEFAESKQASAVKEEPKAESGFVSAPDLPEDLPFN
jgi:single-strand DNA-binding protein